MAPKIAGETHCGWSSLIEIILIRLDESRAGSKCSWKQRLLQLISTLIMKTPSIFYVTDDSFQYWFSLSQGVKQGNTPTSPLERLGFGGSLHCSDCTGCSIPKMSESEGVCRDRETIFGVSIRVCHLSHARLRIRSMSPTFP